MGVRGGGIRSGPPPGVSRPGATENAGWAGRTGRIDDVLEAVWHEAGLSAANTVAYLCGNPEMVRTAARRLEDRGMAAEAVRSETFWGPPAGREPVRAS